MVCILDVVNGRIICESLESPRANYPAVQAVNDLFYHKNEQYALLRENSFVEVYSSYDKMQCYQSGLEEDIKLLKSSSGSVAG